MTSTSLPRPAQPGRFPTDLSEVEAVLNAADNALDGDDSAAVPPKFALHASPSVDTVLLRLVNLGGALVTATHLSVPEPMFGNAQRGSFSWECRGCGEREVRTDEFAAKDNAREHAAACRAVPMSAEDAAPASAGQVLVAEAVDELACALTEQIAELRDAVCTEITEVATEVAELVEAARFQGRRRRWFWRRRGQEQNGGPVDV
jgi:hypothetical protein